MRVHVSWIVKIMSQEPLKLCVLSVHGFSRIWRYICIKFYFRSSNVTVTMALDVTKCCSSSKIPSSVTMKLILWLNDFYRKNVRFPFRFVRIFLIQQNLTESSFTFVQAIMWNWQWIQPLLNAVHPHLHFKGWCDEFDSRLTAKYQNRHSSKSIWVTKLLFYQIDPPMSKRTAWSLIYFLNYAYYDI